MQRADIHKLGWEHFNSASFEDLLDKAKRSTKQASSFVERRAIMLQRWPMLRTLGATRRLLTQKTISAGMS
eukprot:6485022-Amphidinium_carterae.1